MQGSHNAPGDTACSHTDGARAVMCHAIQMPTIARVLEVDDCVHKSINLHQESRAIVVSNINYLLYICTYVRLYVCPHTAGMNTRARAHTPLSVSVGLD